MATHCDEGQRVDRRHNDQPNGRMAILAQGWRSFCACLSSLSHRQLDSCSWRASRLTLCSQSLPLRQHLPSLSGFVGLSLDRAVLQRAQPINRGTAQCILHQRHRHCSRMDSLSHECWQQIFRCLVVNDTARLARASFGRLTDVGGFEWLVEAHQDYWRLLDYLADVQYEAWLRREELSDSEAEGYRSD